MFTETFYAVLLGSVVIAGLPLLLAGLGEQLSEKAGVLNIGIEGMMILGAFVAFAVTLETDSFWLGFFAGALGGLLVAVPMAYLCVVHSMNQIVVGIALTLSAQGLTALLHHSFYARSRPSLAAAPTWKLPFLGDLSVVGQALFTQHPLVYIAVVAVPGFALLYRRSNIGLNLTAAGESPGALDAAGVSVMATRVWAVLGTGLLAGLGGAFLALVGAGVFVPFMTHGAGFIGIVLAMLARGRPLWVLIGAVVFGGSLALTTALQIAGVNAPTDLVQMLPFAMVLLVLVLFARQSLLPAALGQPYRRGQR